VSYRVILPILRTMSAIRSASWTMIAAALCTVAAARTEESGTERGPEPDPGSDGRGCSEGRGGAGGRGGGGPPGGGRGGGRRAGRRGGGGSAGRTPGGGGGGG